MKINQLLETYSQHINLFGKGLTQLPSDLPDEIAGSFTCYKNHLTSLEGCPTYVGDIFDCGDNQLTSLKGCPKIVYGYFNCSHNLLTSLEFSPTQILAHGNVPGYFNATDNKLSSLQDVHKYITKINGSFHLDSNPIQSHILGLMMIEIGGEITTGLGNGTDVDLILNKWKNQGRRGVMGAMKELTDLGYEELAQL